MGTDITNDNRCCMLAPIHIARSLLEQTETVFIALHELTTTMKTTQHSTLPLYMKAQGSVFVNGLREGALM